MKGLARILALAAVLLYPLAALANDYTTLTVTVTDPNGSVYNGGSATITFVQPSGGIGNFGGVPLSVTTYSVFKFTSAGTFVVVLPDNAAITPSGSQWKFFICSSSGGTCFSSTQTVTGATQNLSTAISSDAVALPSVNSGSITGSSVSVTGNISSTAGQFIGGTANTNVGSLKMFNATSGSVTIQPVTGALGTSTLSLPAATDTLVGKATTDTMTNKTLTSASVTTDIRTTTAGAATLGTTAKPFGSLYLGTAATNNAVITPATFGQATTYTVPDAGTASMTVNGLGHTVEFCGTTTTCAATVEYKPFIVFGDVTLSTSTATIGSLPFTAAADFACTASDLTGVGTASFTYTNGTTAVITGTGGGASDHYRYICVGF